MTNLTHELVKLAYLKAQLLRREAELWERGAQALNAAKGRKNEEPTKPAEVERPPAPVGNKAAYLSINDAATYLGVSRSLLYRLRSLGEGPKLAKIGGRILYSREELNRYMEQSRLS